MLYNLYYCANCCCLPKGRYLNDVRKIFGFFGPPSPPVTVPFTLPISTIVAFWPTPLPPPQCGRHLSIVPKTILLVVSEAMVTSKQSQWLWRSNFTSDLMQATLITMASTCILPGTAIMAIAASIWPQRSLLRTNLNSLASITHVSMSFLTLSVTIGNFSPEGGEMGPLDQRARSAARW